MPAQAQDLYERQLSSLRTILKQDPDTALARFGMTMVHSLTPAERALALRNWGIEIAEPIDYYNLGVHFAREENWSEAIMYFKKAAEHDPTLTDALFNLALCYEKTGHVPQAKATWAIYLKSATDSTEKRKVEAHLAEME